MTSDFKKIMWGQEKRDGEGKVTEGTKTLVKKPRSRVGKKKGEQSQTNLASSNLPGGRGMDGNNTTRDKKTITTPRVSESVKKKVQGKRQKETRGGKRTIQLVKGPRGKRIRESHGGEIW